MLRFRNCKVSTAACMRNKVVVKTHIEKLGPCTGWTLHCNNMRWRAVSLCKPEAASVLRASGKQPTCWMAPSQQHKTTSSGLTMQWQGDGANTAHCRLSRFLTLVASTLSLLLAGGPLGCGYSIAVSSTLQWQICRAREVPQTQYRRGQYNSVLYSTMATRNAPFRPSRFDPKGPCSLAPFLSNATSEHVVRPQPEPTHTD
jgi:hypothetical protein